MHQSAGPQTAQAAEPQPGCSGSNSLPGPRILVSGRLSLLTTWSTVPHPTAWLVPLPSPTEPLHPESPLLLTAWHGQSPAWSCLELSRSWPHPTPCLCLGPTQPRLPRSQHRPGCPRHILSTSAQGSLRGALRALQQPTRLVPETLCPHAQAAPHIQLVPGTGGRNEATLGRGSEDIRSGRGRSPAGGPSPCSLGAPWRRPRRGDG